MAITNVSAARRAGFKITNKGIRSSAAIAMTKIGTRTLSIGLPPNSFTFSGTSVAASEDGIFVVATLPDANTGEMFVSTILPVEYSSGTDVTISIYWKTTATSNAAKFSVELASVVTGETTALDDTQTVTTTTSSTANKINKSSVTFANTLFAASDYIGIHITRDPADAADTLATDLKVVQVVMEFTGQG